MPANFGPSKAASSKHTALPQNWEPMISFDVQGVGLNLIVLECCRLWKIPNIPRSAMLTIVWLLHHK